MLKRFEIKNFKGIKDNVAIDFKPITLLFGPNNAGKSSIVQALHFVREILDRQNFDPYQTRYGANSINLGGFKNILHNHLNSEFIEFKLVYEMDDDLPEVPVTEDFPEIPKFIEQISGQTESVYSKLRLKWVDELQRPLVIMNEIGINNEIVSRIELTKILSGKEFYSLTYINHRHSVSPFVDDEEWFKMFYFLTNTSDENISIQISSTSSAIPTWDSPILLDDSFIDHKNLEEKSDKDVSLEYVHGVASLFLSIGKIFKDELNKFRYIGPIREIPQRNYEPHQLDEVERWASGLGAWDVLYKDPSIINSVNNWLRYLETGYEIQIKNYKEVPIEILDESFEIEKIGDIVLKMNEDIKNSFQTIERNKESIENNMSKLFAGFDSKLKKVVKQSQKPAFNIENLIGTLSGGLLGSFLFPAVGLIAGPITIAALAGQYAKNKISRKEFEEGIQKLVKETIDQELKKVENDINKFQDINKETKEELNSLLKGFRKSFEEDIANALMLLKNESLHITQEIERINKEFPELLKNIKLLENIKNAESFKVLNLVQVSSGTKLLPNDIGIGISQVIPVIVGALKIKSSILAMEQPELHLHPAIQLKLADLFVDQIHKSPGIIYLLETHSEHIMLRLLKRIRESKDSTDSKFNVTPEELNVLYVEQIDGEIEITSLKIDERGRFKNKWPRGFFDERHGELF